MIVLLWVGMAPAHAAVRIASWNLKHLGWNNDKDLEAVAQVIQRFDLIALQEVMKPAAAKALATRVSQRSGEPWGVVVSHTLGDNRYKESYAFLWRESAVTNDGGTTVYLDPGNHFAREPLSSQFTVTVDGKPLRLAAATVHILYGDSKRDRASEIRQLDEYWRWLGQTFEGKRILLGDFNMPPNDPSWETFDSMAQPALTRGASTLGQTGYANLYDNIWTDGTLPISARGIGRFPTWLGLDHATARDRVSDHAPVYIVLDDDAVRTHRVPTREIETDPTACIDLNKASVGALDRLAHVGPSRARDIVAGRPWRRIGDLTRVSGLSAARVADIAGNGSVCPIR
ncbi:Endonuclease/exonuclease/phosphatase [Salinisphaera sp. S4-8]